MIIKKKKIKYLQHPVRKIHQLPLVLGNLCHSGRLVFLQLTDVTGDDLVEEHIIEKQNCQHETFPNISFSKFVSSITQRGKT